MTTRRYVAIAIAAITTGSAMAQDAAAPAPAVPPAQSEPPAQPPAQPQVPVLTQRDRRAAQIDRVIAMVTRVYDDSGLRDEKWDAAARDYFRTGLRWRFAAVDAPTTDDVRKAGKKLYDLGCRDGAVLTLYGVASDSDSHRKSAEKTLAEAEKALEGSAYPKFLLVDSLVYLTSALDSWKLPGGDKSQQRAADALVRFAQDPGELADDPRFVFETLNTWLQDAFPTAWAIPMCERMARPPAVDPWLVSTLAGYTHLRAAWDARGKGYANTVKPEQWEGFYRELDIARRELEAAYTLHPDRPEPAAAMIRVAMGGRAAEGENERFWFGRAVTAQFDWYDAYDNYLWALRPRWSGSHAEMISFGERCRDTSRYDTRVPFYHVQAYLDICDDAGDFDRVLRTPGLYEDLKKTMNKLIDGPVGKVDAAWDRSLAASIAVRAGHPEDAAAWIQANQGRLIEGAPDRVRISAAEVLREARVASSPAAPAFLQIANAASAGQWADVPRMLDDAYAACDQSENPIREAVYCKLVSGKILADFHQGKPVEFKFVHQPSLSLTLAGWRAVKGAWNNNYGDTGVFGDPREGLQLICYAQIGRRWELTGRVEFKKDSRNNRADAGIIFGYDTDSAAAPRFQTCRLTWPDRALCITDGFRANKVADAPIELGKSHTFKFRVWDNNVAFFLDDVQLYAGEVPMGKAAESWTPGDRFGFGGPSTTGDAIVTFSRLKLQKLTREPETP